MAVQPLNKTKIIKKIKHHPNRFQGDRFKRVGVSDQPSIQKDAPSFDLSVFLLNHLCGFTNCARLDLLEEA